MHVHVRLSVWNIYCQKNYDTLHKLKNIYRFSAFVTGLHPSAISCKWSVNQQQSLGA